MLRLGIVIRGYVAGVWGGDGLVVRLDGRSVIDMYTSVKCSIFHPNV